MGQEKSFLTADEQATVDSYDQIAEHWAADHDVSDFWSEEMNLFQLLLPPPALVLEIGAGGGRDAKQLIERGYDYIGSDISGALLEVARKNLPRNTFLLQSVYELATEIKYDGFWASAILLHIPKSRIFEALSRIRSICLNGAVGFISLKDGDGERMEDEDYNGRNILRHFTYWRREQFEPLLLQSGFKVVDYSYRPMSHRTQWHCFFVEAVGFGTGL